MAIRRDLANLFTFWRFRGLFAAARNQNLARSTCTGHLFCLVAGIAGSLMASGGAFVIFATQSLIAALLTSRAF